MASQDQSPRPPTPTIGGRVFNLSDRSDLSVYVMSVKNTQGQRSVSEFKVSKEALTSKSEYFKNSTRFNARGNHKTVMKDDSAPAMRVWLMYMHATEEEAETIFQRAGVHDCTILHIWELINVGDKYQFDAAVLQGFFEKWYAKNVDMDEMEDDFARQLALPCFVFNHAQGFAHITKWLAYNISGHINEKRPTWFKWTHQHLCPADFVGPMNHARGRLRTVLHARLHSRAGDLLKEGKHNCTCGHWARSVGLYLAALTDIAAYPLEDIFPKSSVDNILCRLRRFSIGNTGGCTVCNVKWGEDVRAAVDVTERYFDGLCIDCMDHSRLPKGKDPDEEYWRAVESVDGRWDTHCRIRHGEPSWYVSWCGRDEHRQKLLKAHRVEKRRLEGGE